MKNNTSYSTHKETTHIIWLITLLMLTITGCTPNEQKHSNHHGTPSNSPNSTTQPDSIPGVNMSNGNQASNETYWNVLPPNKTVIARQETVKPMLTNMDFTISGNGYITFDVRRNRRVPIPVGGRIERLFVKYNYQYIHKGEKILELYSPELNTYIEEYLYIKQQVNDPVLLEEAKKKLLLIGLTTAQLKQINQTRGTTFSIPIYSPYEGYVLFTQSGSSPAMKNTTYTTSGMENAMSNSPASPSFGSGTSLPDNSIREGMYISKDQTLFWINDFKEVWGIISFAKENEKYIQKEHPITIKSELKPADSLLTSIRLIEQVYQEGQKFMQIRVYLSNTKRMLKQNSLIIATVTVPVNSLTVPSSSVYYLGKIAIVWVRAGVTKEGSNIFQSRVVKTGHRNNDKIEIQEGLNENELIAKDAGYLADSETIIKY